MGSKEHVYDSEIAPLMTQIIAVCQREHIPMIADFGLDPCDEGERLHATTALLRDSFDPSPRQQAAFDVLRPKPLLSSNGAVRAIRHHGAFPL